MAALPNINFNAKALIVVGIILVLGIVLGEHRAKRIAMGSFVGFIVADKLGQGAFNYLQKQTWGQGVSLSTVQIVLFAAFVLLLTAGHSEELGRGHINLKLIILSLLTSVFIIASLIGFLPPGSREQLVTDYNIAALIYNWQYGWLLATALWMALLNYLPKPDKKK